MAASVDIVERLRDGSFSVDLCREAADEIERLRSALLGHAREMARVALTDGTEKK